jgi:ribosomal protein L16 Arg81 hydroxylase
MSAFCDEMVADAPHALLRQAVTEPVAHPAEIGPSLLEGVQETLVRRWERMAQDGRFLGRALTEPKPNVAAFFGTHSSEEDVRRAFSEGGHFERQESSRFLFMEERDRIHLFVDGEDYPLFDFSAPRALAEHLCEASPVQATTLLRWAGEDRREDVLDLLVELAEVGALLAKVPGPR